MWNRFCDRVARRDFLRVGALGSGLMSGLGLNLGSYLRMAEAGQVRPAKSKAAIYIRLGGGPTHMDTFDLKPNAPAELRGELKPISTNVPGIEISELLPKLSQCADKYVILRGVSHSLAAHELGTKYMNTGNRPLPSLEFPGMGAVISKELATADDLPPFVAIPNTPQTGGYLGIQYGAFNTNSTPSAGQTYRVRGISLKGDMSLTEVDRRQKLLHSVDTAFRGYESKIDVLAGLEEFSDRAYNMISSPRARDAFDIAQEPEAVVQRFGDHNFGQSCLLALRLVQSGVPFATVNNTRWDMHQNIFANLREKALPELDQGLAALFATLSERGMLDTTTVIVTGEFGRTPKINDRAGRDHWPRAMFVLMAGGGIRGGRVLGASDDKGMGPADAPIIPDDIAASFYHTLGIDHHKEYKTPSNRPVMIVREGKIIPELFA